ncbi:hypothetical protein TW84_19255 [Vibrio neptunius]|uniref:ABC transporter substrate-binding protein n=1 Tax=Vibrio neptunius TaxID=170651 RepID=UPI0005F9AF95|nr:ABC transporter substrate-binding protein [Vibrio neptunius]KJY86528.1 hypothetical protein TW84_19255 [Vibrio neptunius]
MVNHNLISQAFALALLLFTIGMLSSDRVQASETLKVGIMVGKLTNTTSTSNKEKLCVLNALTDEVSASRRNVEFTFVSNDRTAHGSALAAHSLVDQGIDVALLPLVSHEAEIAARILNQHDIAFVTSATAKSVIKDPSMGLSIMPSNKHQIKLLSDYYLSHYPTKTAHVLIDNSRQYSKQSALAFIKQLTAHSEPIKFKKYDYSMSNADDIVGALPNNAVVFAPLYNPNIAVLYNAMKDSGKSFTILGTDSVGARKEFFQTIGTTSPNINLYFVKNWDGIPKSDNRSALNSISNTFCSQNQATFLTTYTYDLFNFLIAGYDSKPQPSPQDLIESLKQLKFETVMDGEPLTFDAAGYSKKPLYLFSVQDNRVRYLSKLTD